MADADFAITKSGDETAAADTDVTYTVTVTNFGPDPDSADVIDNIPAGMTFVSATQNNGPAFSCTTPAQGDPGTIDCTIATMNAGESAEFVFTMHIPPGTPDGTTFTNTATVMAPSDVNEENNSGSVGTTVNVAESDGRIEKTGPSSAGPDTDVVYTIAVGNNGPSDAADFSFADTLPGDMTFAGLQQIDGPTLNCTTPAFGAGGTITCTALNYPAGATSTFTLTGHVPSGTPSGTEYTNAATVSATNDQTEENNVSTTTLVISSTDVSIVKSGPASSNAGDEIVYTITVANAVQSDIADTVFFSDDLPPGTTFVDLTQDSGPFAGCTQPAVGQNGQIACTFGQLLSGQSAQFTLKILPGTNTSGSITNNTTVSSQSFDRDPNNNSSGVTTTITPVADLSVVKSGAATATAGQNYTYTIDVANNGPSDAANVTLTDTLPANATFVSVTQNSGPLFNCTSGATVTCTVATLAAGDTASFALVVNVPASATGSLQNAATVASDTLDSNALNNNTSLETAIVASTDVAIAKTAGATVNAGTDLTWTVTVTNNGPSDAANVSVTDTLPANTTFVSATQPTGPTFSCTGGATITCTIATLASGATATFSFTGHVDPSATGTIDNTATISTTTPETNNNNNSSTSSTAVVHQADLTIAKSAPATAVAGTTMTYTINVSNVGPSDADSVMITDVLPAGTTFAGINQTSGPTFICNGFATITCSIATFANGANATFELMVTVNSSTTGTVSNTATVASSSTDPNGNNNSSTASTDLTTSANLAIAKEAPGLVTAGNDSSYTINVANLGPSDAVNATITDVLPAGTTFVGIEQTLGPTFTCTTGQPVTCTIAAFPGGASATFSLTVHIAPSATGTISNTATISSTTTDPDGSNNSATASSVVQQSADVSIVKTSPNSVMAGTDVTYTINVGNNGPSDASNVSFTDTLPADTTFVSLTQTSGNTFTCTTGAVVTCSIATLAPASTASFNLVVHVASTTMSAVSNTATISTTTPDPVFANDTSTTFFNVTTSSDVVVVKTAPATLTAGQNATYTIEVTNNGPSDAVSVTLKDVQPGNTTFVSFTQTGGAPFTCTTIAPFECSAVTLANGASATFAYTVHLFPSASGTITNTANVTTGSTDPVPANNSSTTTNNITVSSDVAVTKSAPATVTAGQTVTYTINVTNNGPSDATQVQFTDTLPAGTAFVSIAQIAGFPWVCAPSAPTCSVATLMNGGSASFQVVAQVAANATGTLTNSVNVTSTSSDPTPANNTATASSVVTSAADVSVTKNGPPSVTAGGNLTYTITVTNAGPSDAQQVQFTDTLPAGTTFVSIAQTGGAAWVCAPAAPTCSVATLIAGGSATFTLVAQVAANATGTLTNSVNVTSATSDPTPANNTATANSTVGNAVDVSVTKNGPASVAAGSNLTYTITVANAGPSDAMNVTLSDTLPTNASFVSMTQTSGPTFACSSTTTVTCTIAALVPNAAASFTLVVMSDPAATGTVNNTATVSTTSTDGNPANNSSSTSTAVDPGPTDLRITKSVNNAQLQPGGSATYTIVVTNGGPGVAAGVAVNDVLPAGTTFQSYTATQGTCSGTTTITCSIGTLLPNATATITLTVGLPNTPGEISNTATVSALNAETAPGNNSAIAAALITPQADVPALSPFGLMLCAALLAMAALVVMKR
ncbi:MAG TPA: DUF11 domain-containing protein [Thermoanaerobaculia bacterium]|nr:DUF11 domain-containing protein [Thermoanaerobaculia bacterium]